jgi:hypothetical protein
MPPSTTINAISTINCRPLATPIGGRRGALTPARCPAARPHHLAQQAN